MQQFQYSGDLASSKLLADGLKKLEEAGCSDTQQLTRECSWAAMTRLAAHCQPAGAHFIIAALAVQLATFGFNKVKSAEAEAPRRHLNPIQLLGREHSAESLSSYNTM